MSERTLNAGADAELVERVEAEGWAARHQAVGPEFQTRFGTEVRRYGRAVAMLTRHVDFPSINRVFLLGLKDPLTTDLLDTIIADYGDAGVARMVLHWSPNAVPVQARDWFANRGFRELRPMAILRRRTDPELMTRTPLRIVEIDRSDAAVYEQTVAPADGVPAEVAPHVWAALGHPAWRHYLAYDGDRAIAGASLFAHGSAAWCAGCATLPEARRRGAQSALLARRIHDAAIMGCDWIVAETLAETPEHGNPSYRNMRRLGFEDVYLRASFLLDLHRPG